MSSQGHLGDQLMAVWWCGSSSPRAVSSLLLSCCLLDWTAWHFQTHPHLSRCTQVLAWVLQPWTLSSLLPAVEPSISSATRNQDDKGCVNHKSSSHFNADFSVTAVSGLSDSAVFYHFLHHCWAIGGCYHCQAKADLQHCPMSLHHVMAGSPISPAIYHQQSGIDTLGGQVDSCQVHQNAVSCVRDAVSMGDPGG